MCLASASALTLGVTLLWNMGLTRRDVGGVPESFFVMVLQGVSSVYNFVTKPRREFVFVLYHQNVGDVLGGKQQRPIVERLGHTILLAASSFSGVITYFMVRAGNHTLRASSRMHVVL